LFLTHYTLDALFLLGSLHLWVELRAELIGSQRYCFVCCQITLLLRFQHWKQLQVFVQRSYTWRLTQNGLLYLTFASLNLPEGLDVRGNFNLVERVLKKQAYVVALLLGQSVELRVPWWPANLVEHCLEWVFC